MEDAIVQFTMTGKASFSSFALSVIADIQRILVRQAILAPIAGGISSAFGSMFGNASTAAQYGTNIGSQQTSMLAAQDAGMMSFAVGTNYVPNDMIAQIHKGEAIVPAAYNPAAGGLGSGQVNNVSVVVNTGGGQDSSTANNQDATKLGALISNVVKATIIKEQRNGGLLSGA